MSKIEIGTTHKLAHVVIVQARYEDYSEWSQQTLLYNDTFGYFETHADAQAALAVPIPSEYDKLDESYLFSHRVLVPIDTPFTTPEALAEDRAHHCRIGAGLVMCETCEVEEVEYGGECETCSGEDA